MSCRYAVGLLLISPLGDLVRRRPLMLILVFLTTTLSIGLAITSSLAVFEVLSFLVGMFSVVPQILIPLAADLAPAHRRASAISVVLAGLLCGILYARVIGGVIAEFTSWRVVFYVAIGIQAVVFAGMYWMLPDYPAKNPQMSYFGILTSMGKYAVTEPILIQASLISIASSACFSAFWVTLTFLLGGPPYHYSTYVCSHYFDWPRCSRVYRLTIGLFGLVGAVGVALAPVTGKFVDKLVPWWATLVGIFGYMAFQAIQVAAGGIHIAAVVLACIGLDLFRQMAQISLTSAVYAISQEARARLNAVLIISIFIGQVMGTSVYIKCERSLLMLIIGTAVGTLVFTKYGWRACAGMSLGWMGFELLVLLLRGPHCPRYTWFGYAGGVSAKKGIAVKPGQQIEKGSEATSANEQGTGTPQVQGDTLNQVDAETAVPPVQAAEKREVQENTLAST
jgi:predicted MFS family arabinose efflux permease